MFWKQIEDDLFSKEKNESFFQTYLYFISYEK